MLVLSPAVLAEVSWVLNPAGKAGRGIVEVLGDPKTGRWTTPSIDHVKHDAFFVSKQYSAKEHVVETFVHYTGDNCNEDESLCLALYYFKSTRGDMDFDDFNRIVFEINMIEAPTDAVLLRIGSYPTRAEFDIREKLPSVDEGWKTVTVEREELEQHLFENFTFKRVADPFSLTTSGTVKYEIRRIRWEK